MSIIAELEEALTASGVAPLVQKQIDPLLLEYQRRYAPLLRALPSTRWGSTTYFFNTRTSRAPGGFVQDGGARPVGSSTYLQNKFDVKNLQAVGAVTGYAQEVTRDLIQDLRAREIEGTIAGLYWDIEAACLWGSNAATLNGPYPGFDGLDNLCNTFSGAAQNAIDLNHGTMALRHLDLLIDLVETNAAMPVYDTGWMIVASPTMVSKVAQIQTNQQRFVDQVEVATGLLVPTYKNIPLVKSSFLGTKSWQMGTVTAANATTGGSLGNTLTYKYTVSAVIARQGEIAASAEVSQVTGATSTNAITLSFTPPQGLDGSTPMLYKVYRTAAGGATGTETLLGVVDAYVGFLADGITPVVATSIVDTGSQLIPQNGATQPAQLVNAYVGTNVTETPRAVNDETAYLLPRNPDIIIRPYVREVQPVDVYPTTTSPDALPFALVADTCLALRAPKYVGRLSNFSAAL